VLCMASCGSRRDRPSVTTQTSYAEGSPAATALSLDLAHVFAGLVADVRTRQSGNAVDTYATAFHWRVMPEETKALLNAKIGYVGRIDGQLVLLASDGTSDVFSLTVPHTFKADEILAELRHIYTIDKRASETSDGQRFDIYGINDGGTAVGVLSISSGVVDAIAGTGTVAFASAERAKRQTAGFKIQ
jgi:hypothetical protein